jgi:hypothetical protein
MKRLGVNATDGRPGGRCSLDRAGGEGRKSIASRGCPDDACQRLPLPCVALTNCLTGAPTGVPFDGYGDLDIIVAGNQVSTSLKILVQDTEVILVKVSDPLVSSSLRKNA